MRSSETTAELVKALLKAELTNPPKGSTAKIDTRSGGSFSYEYAALPDILEVVRPSLAAQGLVLFQDATTTEGRTTITTRLAHTSGDWIEAGPLAVPHGSDAQGVGSAVTYGRRYQLLAILGLAADDDDGSQAAVSTWHERTQASPQQGQDAKGREGRSASTQGEKPTSGTGGGSGEGPESGTAPSAEQLAETQALLKELRKLVGSNTAVRDAVNVSNQTSYTVKTIAKADPAHVKLAIAEWMEAHPTDG